MTDTWEISDISNSKQESRTNNELVCICELMWDGVSGVSGIGVCGRCGGDGGAGLQLAVRYGVSTLHGARGGSLLGLAR